MDDELRAALKELNDELLTLEEAMKYLKLARSTIYNMVGQGEIPFLKAGGRLRFRKSALDTWMEDCAKKSAA